MMFSLFTKWCLLGLVLAIGCPKAASAVEFAEGCVLYTDPQDKDHQVLTCPSGVYNSWSAYCYGQLDANRQEYCGATYCRPPLNSLIPDGCFVTPGE